MNKILTIVLTIIILAACSTKKDMPQTATKKVEVKNSTVITKAPETITDPKATEVWEPEPEVVDASKSPGSAPSDAIVLFGGDNIDEWVHYDGSPAQWTVSDGIITCKPGTGDIKTKKIFGDVQFHIEWRSPSEPNKKGQDKGNSGVFFQRKYEVQILNSFNNRTYSNGQAGAIYKQHPPLVNATVKTGDWNTYDVIFHAPVFEGEQMVKNGTMTVLHNGVLIQDHSKILGTTEYIGPPKVIPHGDDHIVIQDHSNYVSYRNIWLREL